MKFVRGIIKFFFWLLCVIFTLPVIAYLIFQSPAIQTKLVNSAGKYMLENYGAVVKIKRVDIGLINQVILEGVYLQDKKKDTMLYAGAIKAFVKGMDLNNQKIYIDKVVLDDLYANLYEDSTKTMNYQFLIDAFASKDSTPVDTSKSNLRLLVDKFELKNTRLKYKLWDTVKVQKGINFNDIYVKNLNLSIDGLLMKGDTISVHLKDFNLEEKSGFKLNQLATWVKFTPRYLGLYMFKFSTPYSKILVPHVRLSYKSTDDLSDFLNKVTIHAKIDTSVFQTNDLDYIVADLAGMNQKISFSGIVDGTVANLRAKKFSLFFANKSYIKTDLTISGLPDMNKTFIYVDLKDLATSKKDLATFKLPPFGKNDFLPLPAELDQLGEIRMTGLIRGTFTELMTISTLSTAIGKISANAKITNDTTKKTLSIEGDITPENVAVGRLIQSEDMIGPVSGKLNFKTKIPTKGDMEVMANGTISSIGLNHYTYRNLTLDAKMIGTNVSAKLNINDPNINLALDAAGKLTKVPEFKVSLMINDAELKKLNLYTADSICKVGTKLVADIKGSGPDDITGNVKISSLYFKNERGEINMDGMTIDINDYVSYRKLSIESDIIDFSLAGQFKTEPLVNDLMTYASGLAPIFIAPPTKKDTLENNINFKLKIKKTKEILKVFAPDVELANNSYLEGKFQSLKNELSIKGFMPYVNVAGNQIKNLYMDGYTEKNMLSMNIEGREIIVGGSQLLGNVNINADIRHDSVKVFLNTQNTDSAVYGLDLSLLTYFTQPEGKKSPIINVEIDPSQFTVSDVTWKIQQSKFIVDTTAIKIENLKIQNKFQYLEVNGKVSVDKNDTLTVHFNKIDLANLNVITEPNGLLLSGKLEGYAHINDLYKKVIFSSDLSIKNFTLNQEMLGNTYVKTGWDEDSKKLALNLSTKIGKVKTLTVSGDYTPATNDIAFDINLNRLRLGILGPYLTGIVSDLKGEVNGNFTIGGKVEKPLIEGSLDFLDTYFTLDASKVRYNIRNNSIKVTNNEFRFEEFNIFDPKFKLLTLDGVIKHKNFEDIKLDLTLKTAGEPFLFLNTEEADNESFYGTAYATGVFNIAGTPENLMVDIAARTEKDSYFYVPLTSASEVSESDFITFINKNAAADTSLKVAAPPSSISGVELKFELEITPDAEMQIIFDAKTGDLIKAKGYSNLSMEINTLGKFNMYGDYVIESGDYLFTLQNIINKKFEVEKGGSISWNGDPTDALVDMKAVYKLKAPLYDLILDTSEVYKAKSPVECKLAMGNKLMEPVISFDIDLPTADDKSKSILSTLSVDERNKQFLSLLILNRFMTPESMKGNAQAQESRSANVGGVTSSELLSNQLSHWLSQISNDFDIGVNYRPGDEISDDQVEVALSTQILNDRVSINGNVGIGSQATSSGVVGDFDIAYKITKNGKLRVKAFTKANDNTIDNTGPYTQGVGIFYREDFNKFGDLMRKYWSKVLKKKSTKNT